MNSDRLPTTDNRPPGRRPAGFAVFVAAGILLSRISGLIREKVFAHFLGNSVAAGVWKAAFRVPNLLQNLFGEGALSASFIPVYAKLLAEKDEEAAGRVAGMVAALLSLVIAVIVSLGVLFTPAFLFVIAPGFKGATRELTIVIVRILFPAMGLLVLSAWCLGILNSHRRFFLSYVAPVFMNIVMIATLLSFGARMTDRSLVIAAAWGTVVGALAQFAVQLPTVLRHERGLKFAIDMTFAPVREVLRNFAPVVVSRGVVQLSGYLDMLIATLLSESAVAALGFAQTIYQLPIALFGMSVAAAELPQMSSALGSEADIHEALRKRLSRGLRQITFFVVPTVAAFLFIGRELVAALYQGGRFTPDDTLYVWYILAGSTVGLLAATLGRLYSSAFYALRDTRTPLWFAVIRVVITGISGYLFAIPFRPLLLDALRALNVPLPSSHGTAPLGGIALTATAGVAGWIEFLMLRHALRKRIGGLESAGSYEIRVWVAAIVAGVVGFVCDRFVESLPAIPEALIVATIFGVVYFAVGFILGIPEVKATLGRFRRR